MAIKWSDIVKKASENPEFMEKLLADPKAAIQDATGVTLPDDINFYVHKQSSTNVHLVLPLHVTEPDAAKDKAVFLEPDDESNDAVFLEPDDTVGTDGVFLEPDDDTKK